MGEGGVTRDPVITAAELQYLDADEIIEGYRGGLAGEPEPGGNRSKSYWHGWRNGHNDRNRIADAEQDELIRDMRRCACSEHRPCPEHSAP